MRLWKFIILGKKAPKYGKGVKVKMKKKRNRSVPSYSNIYRWLNVSFDSNSLTWLTV